MTGVAKGVKAVVLNLNQTKITDKSVESLIDFVVNVKGSLHTLEATWEGVEVSELKREIFHVIKEAIMNS